jgi:cytochrome c oxidase subunit 1
MFGKQLDQRLGKIHFWTSVVGITLVFGGQLLAGYAGQQRRLYDPFQYQFLQHLRGLNRWTSYFAFALFGGQLLFVWNWFATVLGKGRPAEENPWQVGTLEWTNAATPPAHHNYDVIPAVVRGPHELSNPEAQRLLGRDWVGQAEQVPGLGPGGGKG